MENLAYSAEQRKPLPMPEKDDALKGKQSADIITFKTPEETPLKKNEMEGEVSFTNYQTMGGIMSEEEYGQILARWEKGVALHPDRVTQAKTIARVAKIELSGKTIALYHLLRDETKPEASYTAESDQKLLADALRLDGKKYELGELKKWHPNIFR